MILIGITGTHGAGKGTITNYLAREHGFSYVSVSEFLAREAERGGMKPDRHARRAIANQYRTKGPTALMEAAYATIDPRAERVILEPQYTPAEVAYMQEKGGVVIALDADLRTRYDRVHVRGSMKDDVSFEEFKASQEKEMRSDDASKQNLARAMEAADIQLLNDGTVKELEAKLLRKLKSRELL